MNDIDDLGEAAREALERLEVGLRNSPAKTWQAPKPSLKSVGLALRASIPPHLPPEELNKLLHAIDEMIGYYDSLPASNDREHKLMRQRLSRRRENVILQLWEQTSKKTASSLKELIENLPNDGQRELLEAELEDLQRDTSKLQVESRQVMAQRDHDDAMMRAAVMERKWDVWSRILARESIATLIGSLLLIMLAIVLVVAMFTKAQSSDIVNNTFLIVLGYFFGNSGKEDKGGKTRSSD